MLPTLESVLATHAFLKRRHRWRWDVDPSGLDEALREAQALAGEREEDEPAALFLALTRRRNDLADAWESLPFVFVKGLVAEVFGADLDVRVDDPGLHALRMKIVARQPVDRATLDDVRAFLAGHLRRRA
jgi:hypothetical protein